MPNRSLFAVSKCGRDEIMPSAGSVVPKDQDSKAQPVFGSVLKKTFTSRLYSETAP